MTSASNPPAEDLARTLQEHTPSGDAHAFAGPILDGDRLRGRARVRLLSKLMPIHHALTLRDVERYRVEPYVVAADVYSGENEGRGGWTWYTGAAGWMYRIAVEWTLGVRISGACLTIRPCVPSSWAVYSVRFRYKSAIYDIRVQPGHELQIRVDGVLAADGSIALVDDGKVHRVRASGATANRLAV
jgi:cyclic beta-1,2-glucan synthetase